MTSEIAQSIQDLASSSEPAAEFRSADNVSRSAVLTETLPPFTTSGAGPFHMCHGCPVSSGAGPLYGAVGAVGGAGADSDLGACVA